MKENFFRVGASETVDVAVRVRAYLEGDGGRIYGGWSEQKTVHFEPGSSEPGNPQENEPEIDSNLLDDNFEWVSMPRGSTDEWGITRITGIVKNRSSKKFSYVNIEFYVYDADGNRIGSASAVVRSLGAGSNWKFEAVYFGKAASFEYGEITYW